jgi:hypothetical protein
VNTIYRQLSDRILGAIPDIDRVLERTLRAWPRAKESSEALDVYLDAVALNLHGFYSGLERLFELIAGRVDHSLPASEVWHRDLLFQMGREIQGVRPAVISQYHVDKLDEFRRFRHLVRNVYTVNLLPDRKSKLILALPDLWSQLRAELMAFADFTKDLAAQ